MLFSNLSATLLAFAAIASALPHAQSEAELSERGLVWSRGKNSKDKNNKNDKTVITDTTITQLTEVNRNSETQLTVLVEKKLVIKKDTRKSKDNVRKNHYSSKNQNVDTIVVVITKIIDERDSNNKNTRYMQHQVHAKGKNSNGSAKTIVAVTEIEAITISSDSNSNKKGKSDGKKGSGKQAQATKASEKQLSASGAAEAAFQTVDPSAPFAASNATVMLPSGAAAPAFANVELDPARIIEADQSDAFVQAV